MIELRANRGGRMPPPLSSDAIRRRRECAADDARWEARLRSIALAGTQECGTSPTAGPAAVRTALDVIDGVTRYDSLLLPRALPMLTGGEAEDLVCGKCGETIALRASRDTVRESNPNGDRLVIRCICRALNVICGEAGRRNRHIFKQRMPLSWRARRKCPELKGDHAARSRRPGTSPAD